MRFPGSRLAAMRLASSITAVVLLRVPHAGTAPAQDPGQRPVFRGGANLVLVDAYPRKDGHIVEGLEPGDFEIAEDGVPQKVDQFEFVRVSPAIEPDRRDPNNQREMLQQAADPHNRVFVIYLDKYNVEVSGAYYSRKPIVEMLNKLIGPNDLFGVMTANIRVSDLVLQRNSYSIESQLSRHWDWGEEGRLGNDPEDPFENFLDACCACDAKGLKDRRREHKSLTTMMDLVRYLKTIREARTTLIVFSGGWQQFEPQPGRVERQTPSVTTRNGRLGVNEPADSFNAAQHACVQATNEIMMYDDRQLYRDLIDEAVRSNVVFYTIDPCGLRAPGSDTCRPNRNRLDSLMTLADNTDGLPIVNTNDLMAGANRIINDVSAYYLLGYYSTNLKRDGGLRRIKVKLTKPGMTVVARRSYVAENAAATARAAAEARTTAGPSAPDAVAEAVKGAMGSLARLDNSSEMMFTAVRGRSELVVVAEISATAIAAPGSAWTRGATIDATAMTATGEKLGVVSATIEAGKRSVLLRLPIENGRDPARVSIAATGQGSNASEQVAVAGAPGDLVGAPLVFRGTASAQSALMPVADQLFRRTERVHVEWSVARTLDRRDARLLDRRGMPLPVEVTLTERDATTGPSIVTDLLLSPLAAGDYVIELTAAAGTETVHRYLPLRVAR